eukprot:1979-Pleurochrysis_carterae.AAC.1
MHKHAARTKTSTYTDTHSHVHKGSWPHSGCELAVECGSGLSEVRALGAARLLRLLHARAHQPNRGGGERRARQAHLREHRAGWAKGTLREGQAASEGRAGATMGRFGSCGVGRCRARTSRDAGNSVEGNIQGHKVVERKIAWTKMTEVQPG